MSTKHNNWMQRSNTRRERNSDQPEKKSCSQTKEKFFNFLKTGVRCSSATYKTKQLNHFECYLLISYCAVAVVYVDILSQPIRLCQLAKSINHHYKKQ